MSRLTVFKHMLDQNAEANWNLDEHLVDGTPLELEQRHTLTDSDPKGLSFFSFVNDHSHAVIVDDLPESAEAGVTLAIVAQGNDNLTNTNAHRQLIQQKRQLRKVRNSDNREITLKPFLCYKANSELLSPECQFTCVWDNNPNYHRTLTPTAGVKIACTECEIDGRAAADPTGAQPPLLELMDFQLHCFRIRAGAEPIALKAHFDSDVHRLATALYRGLDTDCTEEHAKRTIDVLRFLDLNDYSLNALKLLKKADLLDLLLALFMSECLDEEETKKVGHVLSWVREELDRRSVSSRGTSAAGSYTKLQATGCDCEREDYTQAVPQQDP